MASVICWNIRGNYETIVAVNFYMGKSVLDEKGYRPNVGIIILNADNKVFWGRRVGQNSWQFPQGGIDEDESLEDAMYRELREETGLLPKDVEIISQTKEWLSYDLPKKYRRNNTFPLCVGQKQKWYLLRLVSEESCFDITHSEKPEFEDWKWVDFWFPVSRVIFFKRKVYRRALEELSRSVSPRPKRKYYPSRHQHKRKGKATS